MFAFVSESQNSWQLTEEYGGGRGIRWASDVSRKRSSYAGCIHSRAQVEAGPLLIEAEAQPDRRYCVLVELSGKFSARRCRCTWYQPVLEMVGPSFSGSGIDAGESVQRNWLHRNAPPSQQQRIGEECARPRVTASPYVLPVLHPRRVHVGNQPTRHHYSDLQRGQPRSRTFGQAGQECGSGPIARVDSVPSTGVPSQSIEGEIPFPDLVL